jgi:alcohol dehydrogenase (cytochrome c)
MAVTARTGEMLWFTPLVEHDAWDYDPASPVVIFDLHKDGKTIHAVGEAGKSGRYFMLDASTGKRLFDPLPFVTQHHPVPTGSGTLVCPGELGGSQYSPVAYNPRTHATYVSGINYCTIIKLSPDARIARHQRGRPDLGGKVLPGPGKPTGTFTAVDVDSGQPLWKRSLPAPMIGGATAAGDLVFAGGSNGVLYAFGAVDGRIWWRRDLGAAFGSAPIAYAIKGKEYLAVVSGGAVVTALHHLGPLGHTLFVFTLDGEAAR